MLLCIAITGQNKGNGRCRVLRFMAQPLCFGTSLLKFHFPYKPASTKPVCAFFHPKFSMGQKQYHQKAQQTSKHMKKLC